MFMQLITPTVKEVESGWRMPSAVYFLSGKRGKKRGRREREREREKENIVSRGI